MCFRLKQVQNKASFLYNFNEKSSSVFLRCFHHHPLIPNRVPRPDIDGLCPPVLPDFFSGFGHEKAFITSDIYDHLFSSHDMEISNIPEKMFKSGNRNRKTLQTLINKAFSDKISYSVSSIKKEMAFRQTMRQLHLQNRIYYYFIEANEKNADSKIIYQVCGLDDYDYPADSYDCVISNLVLHYIADIDTIFKKIFRTLKMDGIFLLNIEHPVFTAGVKQDWIYNSSGEPQFWPVDNYFYPGERITNFLGHNVTKQHHTLTQILTGLINAGLKLQVVEEAMPDADMMNLPGMSDEMRRPMMLLIKSLK